MNQYQYLPLTKVHCYWGFLTFHLCAFNVLNRLPHDIWPSCLFGLFLAMAVSQAFLVSDDFDNFEQYQSLSFRKSLYRNFSDFFLMIRLGCIIWEERSQR